MDKKMPSASRKASVSLTSKLDKPTSTATRHDMFVEKLAAVPQLQTLSLYTMSCKKHVFPGHVVLQFDCTNTLADLLLETVRVELELGEGCEELATVSI